MASWLIQLTIPHAVIKWSFKTTVLMTLLLFLKLASGTPLPHILAWHQASLWSGTKLSWLISSHIPVCTSHSSHTEGLAFLQRGHTHKIWLFLVSVSVFQLLPLSWLLVPPFVSLPPSFFENSLKLHFLYKLFSEALRPSWPQLAPSFHLCLSKYIHICTMYTYVYVLYDI